MQTVRSGGRAGIGGTTSDSDTPLDPHSPAHVGLWRAHLGWVLERESEYPDHSNIKDLVRYPELRFLDRHKWLPLVAYAVWLLS